jgi:TPP-dependent 2-oxoacid decarboxylase
MVTTTFANLTDGFQFFSLFDQAFAQCTQMYGAVQVTTSGGTYTIAPTAYNDILIVGSGANTVQLPDSTLRNNQPVSVVDINNNAATFNITILPFGTQKIMGQNSIKITSNNGGFTLWPISTGGWYQK